MRTPDRPAPSVTGRPRRHRSAADNTWLPYTSEASASHSIGSTTMATTPGHTVSNHSEPSWSSTSEMSTPTHEKTCCRPQPG